MTHPLSREIEIEPMHTALLFVFYWTLGNGRASAAAD
jgi:hypothetical protein